MFIEGDIICGDTDEDVQRLVGKLQTPNFRIHCSTTSFVTGLLNVMSKILSD